MVPVTASGPFRFDVESLLLPISDEAPSGESLRYDAVYDEIRAARTEDDPVLQQGVWKTQLRKADWAAAERLCRRALQERSKDLQIAAWLLESWVHLHSFAGLHEGLRLMTGLCEIFWDTLHPEMTDEDSEFRVGPFEWLNEKVAYTLKLLPITAPASEDARSYCWADWETVNRRGQADAPPPGKNDRAVTQLAFQQSVLLTPTSFFRDLRMEMEAAMDGVAELEAVLEARLGAHSPSLRQFPSTLDTIRGLIRGILNQRGPEAEASVSDEEIAMPQEDPKTPAADEPPAMLSSSGPIRNRAEAYLRLAEAADYLERTEPHSPAPYLVKRAIVWGSMRLEKLLPELVRNNGELDEIFRLLQISKSKGS